MIEEKKPSERIQEILNNDGIQQSRNQEDLTFAIRLIYAISDYLDEQHEAKELARKESKEKLLKEATCPLDCDCRLLKLTKEE